MGTTSRPGPWKPPICALHAPSIYALQGSVMILEATWHRFLFIREKEPGSLNHHLEESHPLIQNTSFILQFSSVQSRLTLCDPMNCSMPGLSVHHQLLESTQTHVHQVSDAIQPSHPLLSPSPPAFNLSQHLGLFKWVSSSHQVAKVLEFQLHHQSFRWTPRTWWSPLGWTGWISLQSRGLSRVFSNTTVQKHQFFGTQLSL